MSFSQNNTATKTQSSNLSVLQFLMEQYGEKVQELLDQADGSYAKLAYKGEKDDIALMIEGLHYTPLKTNTEMMYSSLGYLGSLVHNHIIRNVFSKNSTLIDRVYAVKTYVGDLRYVMILKHNDFENREVFRSSIIESHDRKPYARFVSVDVDFLPDDISVSDLELDELVELDLSKNGGSEE